MHLLQPVAGDGDAAVDRRVEAKVPVPGAARGERPDPIQINNVLPMAAHKRRARKFLGKLFESLYGGLIIKISSFFFEALIEAFEHFDGFFQFLVGFFELAVFVSEFDFFAG